MKNKLKSKKIHKKIRLAFRKVKKKNMKIDLHCCHSGLTFLSQSEFRLYAQNWSEFFNISRNEIMATVDQAEKPQVDKNTGK